MQCRVLKEVSVNNEKALTGIYDDHGYIYACVCGVRHGSRVTGIRDVIIKKCAEHEKTKGARDEDLERLDKSSWKIDPPSAKFIRKQHVVAGSNKVGRPKGT